MTIRKINRESRRRARHARVWCGNCDQYRAGLVGRCLHCRASMSEGRARWRRSVGVEHLRQFDA